MVRGSLAKRVGLLLMVACGWSEGQTNMNLNGVWKMDPAKSDFGTGPASVSRLDKISVEGSNLKDTITQKLRHGPESTYDMIYTIDSKECTNHALGNLVKSTAQWEGDELVIDSKVYAFREAALKDRYSVSADGRTLTLRRHITGAYQADQKIVFEKQ